MAHKGLRGRGKPRKSATPLKKNKKKEKKGHLTKKEFNKLKRAGLPLTPAKPAAASPKLAAAAAAEPAPAPVAASDAAASTGSAKAELKRQAKAKIKAGAGAEQKAAGAGKQKRKEVRARTAQEQQHLALYNEEERILLVGEGNFSFARALCRALGSGAGVFATSLDDEATLGQKYGDAAAARKEIETKFGGTSLVGVDARRLHKVKEFRDNFHRIVWNFPDLGLEGVDAERNVAQHQKLLGDFFASAAKCLAEGRASQIHVALKEGEPYKSWKIVQTLRAACPELDLVNVVPFASSAWEGYAPRRTAGFEERLDKLYGEELAKGSKVYIFGRKKKK
eukprot:TRINITY_DN14866_c0_g1_i1.p1 TRINITY_DN14866_c0_g1~~TRINITY_DN14866_c0_g1_i1.p1  ORF type:complete len:374 (+),score=103.91 TRINITY_DN14866_c0_g1_i1:112-1122(+)